MRVQSSNFTGDGSPSDVDLVFHVRDYSQSMEADSVTIIGLGDLDSTSGAGNDIRFDFASMAILPDGGIVVAYHDSTDPNQDPMFAIELESEEYFYSTPILLGNLFPLLDSVALLQKYQEF